MDNKENSIEEENDKIENPESDGADETEVDLPEEPVKTVVKSTSKKKKSNKQFKDSYFSYYDDIKISDRQDW